MGHKNLASELKIGILALQGGFDLHRNLLNELASKKKMVIDITLVKKPVDLTNLDGIVLPGGESTVIKRLLESSELDKPLGTALSRGLPAFGTCAGLIILCDHFSVLDCSIERNSYGTQIDSFESDVEFLPTNTNCKAFFIRAPRIISVGESVEVFARKNDEIVGVIQGDTIGITCHPEVAKSYEFHDFFVNKVRQRVKSDK